MSHCICSYQILEEAFRIMIGWAPNYEKNQNIIRTQSIAFFFYFSPLDCLASGFWSSRQCQAWASFCGMGLKLDQWLIGHSHNFYIFIVPTHLPGMICSRSKFLWLDWCPSTTTESCLVIENDRLWFYILCYLESWTTSYRIDTYFFFLPTPHSVKG